jgi:hypothetical protein
MISPSTRFLAQPNEIIPTRNGRSGALCFIQKIKFTPPACPYQLAGNHGGLSAAYHHGFDEAIEQ